MFIVLDLYSDIMYCYFYFDNYVSNIEMLDNYKLFFVLKFFSKLLLFFE